MSFSVSDEESRTLDEHAWMYSRDAGNNYPDEVSVYSGNDDMSTMMDDHHPPLRQGAKPIDLSEYVIESHNTFAGGDEDDEDDAMQIQKLQQLLNPHDAAKELVVVSPAGSEDEWYDPSVTIDMSMHGNESEGMNEEKSVQDRKHYHDYEQEEQYQYQNQLQHDDDEYHGDYQDAPPPRMPSSADVFCSAMNKIESEMGYNDHDYNQENIDQQLTYGNDHGLGGMNSSNHRGNSHTYSVMQSELPIRLTANKVPKTMVGKSVDEINTNALLKRKLRADAVVSFRECCSLPTGSDDGDHLNEFGFSNFLHKMGVVDSSLQGNYVSSIRCQAFVLAEALSREHALAMEVEMNGDSHSYSTKSTAAGSKLPQPSLLSIKHPATVSGISLDGVVQLLEFVIGVEEFIDDSLHQLIGELKKYKLMNKSRKIFSHQPLRNKGEKVVASLTNSTTKARSNSAFGRSFASPDPEAREQYRTARWESVVKAKADADAESCTFKPQIGPPTVLRTGDRCEVKCMVLQHDVEEGEAPRETEQWLAAHILHCHGDGSFDVRFDSNYDEEVSVPRECVRAHQVGPAASRQQDNNIPLHERLAATKLLQSSLYRVTDMRTSEQKEVDQHCTFRPLIRIENPFVSERTLREINRDKEMPSNSTNSSPVRRRSRGRSSSRSRSRSRGNRFQTTAATMGVTGGMYTNGFGFVSGDSIPLGVPLYYFNPNNAPAFERGSYTAVESKVSPQYQAPVEQVTTVMVEQDVEEEVEVEEELPPVYDSDDDDKRIPVAPVLPSSLYEKSKDKGGKAKVSIVISRKEKVEEAPKGISWVDIMAELSKKMNKGGEGVLKKAPEKAPVGKLGGKKKKKKKGKNGKSEPEFTDVIDELSYTLAKLRGEVPEEDEESEEEPEPEPVPEPAAPVPAPSGPIGGLKLAVPPPDAKDVPEPPELDKSILQHLKDIPIEPEITAKEEKKEPEKEPRKEPDSEKEKATAPAPPPAPVFLDRPPPAPYGEPAVPPATDIPLCAPLPSSWPPSNFWVAPPPKPKKLKAPTGGTSTHIVKKLVTNKKMVPVTTTAMVAPPPIVSVSKTNAKHSLPTGYYLPHPNPELMQSNPVRDTDGSMLEADQLQLMGLITADMAVELKVMADRLAQIQVEQLQAAQAAAQAREDELDGNASGDDSRSVAESVYSVGSARSRQGGVSSRFADQIESKLTINDLPLPAGFHGAIQKMKHAREVRTFTEHIEKGSEWRSYEDGEHLASMKMKITSPVAPVSHVDLRNSMKQYEGSTYRKQATKSDVHQLPLTHHFPDLPEGSHIQTATANLPVAVWATSLRKHEDSKSSSLSHTARSGSNGTSITQSPIRPNIQTPQTRTPGGVVRCYPEVPRKYGDAPQFESAVRMDRRKLIKEERQQREDKIKNEERRRIQGYRETLKKKALETAKEQGYQVGNVIERRKTAVRNLMHEYAYRPELALSADALKNAVTAEKYYYHNHPYAKPVTKADVLKTKKQTSARRQNDLERTKVLMENRANMVNIHTKDPVLDNYAVSAYYQDAQASPANAVGSGDVRFAPQALYNPNMSANDLVAYYNNRIRSNIEAPGNSGSILSGGGSGNSRQLHADPTNDYGAHKKFYIPIAQKRAIQGRRASFK